MADVNNIKLSPEQMEAKAAEFNTRCEEFNQVVSTMRNMVTSLCDEWAGHTVAYVIGDSNNNALVFETFDKAVKANPGAHPIFHSDRGYQYKIGRAHV